MADRELLEWLGVTVADLLAMLGAAAIAAMYFVSDPMADAALAALGVGLALAACPLGMRGAPAFSRFTNVVKLVSYPAFVVMAVGAVVAHYLWFAD